MIYFKLKIKPKSSFGTPLTGDSLWGLFWYRYAEIFGTEKVTELLGQDKPLLVFSDPSPEDHLPTPFLPPELIFDSPTSQDRKIIKKTRYLKTKFWEVLRKGANQSLLIQLIGEQTKENEIDKKRKFLTTSSRTRVTIDRLTGSALQGILFDEDEIHYEPLEIFIGLEESILKEENVFECLKMVSLTGYGKGTSIGYGRFNFEKTQIDDSFFGSNLKSNTFFSLNAGLPDSSIDLLAGQTITRFGKYGINETSGFYLKNPVRLYATGSSFNTTQQKSVFGKQFLVPSELNKPSYQCAWLFPFYFQYTNSSKGTL